MAASFSGAVSAPVWEAAVAAVVEKHPMLRVQIEERDEVLELVPNEGSTVRLWLHSRENGDNWRETAGRWLAGSLGNHGGAELVRAVVIQDEGRCDLLLSMHHALGDGRSALGVFEDLMRAVDGVELRPYTMPPDVDQLLEEAVGVLPDASEVKSPVNNRYTPFLPYGQPWAPLETACLSVGETARLLVRARAEGTSVTGALAAAMVRAWRGGSPKRATEPVRLMMPVDVRPRTGLGKKLLLAISTTNQVVPPEQSEKFWDLARDMKAATSAALTDAALLGTAAGRRASIAATTTKVELDELSARYAAWNLLVSNLGAWEPAYQGKALRLDDIWGPAALYGFTGERELGAVTYAGKLRLILASREAEPRLLQAVQQELSAAIR